MEFVVYDEDLKLEFFGSLTGNPDIDHTIIKILIGGSLIIILRLYFQRKLTIDPQFEPNWSKKNSNGDEKKNDEKIISMSDEEKNTKVKDEENKPKIMPMHERFKLPFPPKS